MNLSRTVFAIPLVVLMTQVSAASEEKAVSLTRKDDTKVELFSKISISEKYYQTINLGNSLHPTPYLIADQIVYYDGLWDSTEGRITLEQDGPSVSGTYRKRGGRIYDAILSRGILKGYWVQNYSDRRCSTSVDGSYYWGKLRFNFGGDSFTGSYSYCNGELRYPWNGRRFQA